MLQFVVVTIVALVVSGDARANSSVSCNFSGKKAVIHLKNLDGNPNFGCTAHCEWVMSNKQVFTRNAGTFDVVKGFDRDVFSDDASDNITKSQNATLGCR